MNFLQIVLLFLAFIVKIIASILSFLIFIRVIFSWMNMRFHNLIGDIIEGSTEPILERIRSRLPQGGMFDFSPIIALLGLSLIIKIVEALALKYAGYY